MVRGAGGLGSRLGGAARQQAPCLAAPVAAAAGGKLPLLIDTSAFSRAAHPEVRGSWLEALREDRLRLAPPTRMEILVTARDGAMFGALTARLSAVRPAPLTSTVLRAAEDAMRTLAHRSAGAHRLPVIDYDTLARVMEFESVWLAPAGTLP